VRVGPEPEIEMAEVSGRVGGGAGGDAAHPAAPDDQRGRRPAAAPRMQVRADDLEPYIGLKYLSRLFKLIAIVLILLLIAEVITGLVSVGIADVNVLLGEASRLVVLAGLSWGAGDLAILLIDMGHDLRATRILMGRQLAAATDEQPAHVDHGIARSVTQSDTAV
jgi:hypothetical protein